MSLRVLEEVTPFLLLLFKTPPKEVPEKKGPYTLKRGWPTCGFGVQT